MLPLRRELLHAEMCSAMFLSNPLELFQRETEISLNRVDTVILLWLFFFSNLFPTIARWKFSLLEKGTTFAASQQNFYFIFYSFVFKSTSCEWLLQQQCSVVHAYPLCIVLYLEIVSWSPYLSCIINPKSFFLFYFFFYPWLNSCYPNKDYLKNIIFLQEKLFFPRCSF